MAVAQPAYPEASLLGIPLEIRYVQEAQVPL